MDQQPDRQPDWQKVIDASARYARIKGFSEVQDDFAQYVCEQKLKGRVTITKNLWVDFLRAYVFGGKRHGLSRMGGRGDNGPNPVVLGSDAVIPPGVVEEHRQKVDELIEKHYQPGVDRAIATLLYKWGFSQREVGDIFGITQGRVAQLVKRMNGTRLPSRDEDRLPSL